MTLHKLLNDVNIERIRQAVNEEEYGFLEPDECDRRNIRKCLMVFIELAEKAGLTGLQESDGTIDNLSEKQLLVMILERINNMAAGDIVTVDQFTADFDSLKSEQQNLHDIYLQQNDLTDAAIAALTAAVAQGHSNNGTVDFAALDASLQNLKAQQTELTSAVEAKKQALSAALAQVQTTGTTAATQASDPAAVAPVVAPVDPNVNPNSTAPTTITPAPVDAPVAVPVAASTTAAAPVEAPVVAAPADLFPPTTA